MKISEDPRYQFLDRKRPRFSALGRAVMRESPTKGTAEVAHAVSSTYARRIAAALNSYSPSRRGY